MARTTPATVTVGELLTQYVDHLKEQKKPAAYIIEKCIEANLRPFFGRKKADKLESTDFEHYRKMKGKKVSNATVDHDFTYLKSALLLEFKKTPSRIARVPHIQKSGEDNVRHGFLEFDGYEKGSGTSSPIPQECFRCWISHRKSKERAITVEVVPC